MAAKNNTREMQEMFSQFQAFLSAQNAPAEKAPARKTSPKGTTRKAAKALTGITHEAAWEALGADPGMPHYADKPATNRQLWVLNTRGKLSLS